MGQARKSLDRHSSIGREVQLGSTQSQRRATSTSAEDASAAISKRHFPRAPIGLEAHPVASGQKTPVPVQCAVPPQGGRWSPPTPRPSVAVIRNCTRRGRIRPCAVTTTTFTGTPIRAVMSSRGFLAGEDVEWNHLAGDCPLPLICSR